MCINNRSCVRHVQFGFTIVELIIFIVIVSAAVVGILAVMNLTTAHSADPQIRKQALSIAEALLEEVSQAPFTDCDTTAPSEGGVCNEEDGLGVDPRLKINSGEPVAINDVNDNPIPSLNNYTATISVNPVAFGSASAAVPATDALHITVNVTNGSETITLDGYRARYMPGTLQ